MTTIHTCPRCGSTDITYHWESHFAMAMRDGEVDYVGLHSINTVIPTLYCPDCEEADEEDQACPRDQGDVACGLFQHHVWLNHEEHTFYERPQTTGGSR